MAKRVLQRQEVANNSLSISTTSLEVCKTRAGGGLVRTQLIITNTSSTATKATIAKGDQAAVSLAGIVLGPSGTYVEATDGSYTCYQGPVQVVGDGSGTIAVVESFEEVTE